MNTCLQAAALVLVAGSSVVAQSSAGDPGNRQADQEKPSRSAQPMANHGVYTTPNYQFSSWFKGRDVVGAADGTTIADVQDLLIDRGSGKVEFFIVKTGTILGMGGRTIALPRSVVSYDASDQKFRVSYTKDELKQYPVWSEQEWFSLAKSDKAPGTDGMTFERYYETHRDDRADAYGTNIDFAHPTRIEGVVKSIDQRALPEHGEYSVATIQTGAGEERQVVLGPTWFVSGAVMTPMRGDRVIVNAVHDPANASGYWVAASIQVNSNQPMEVRSNDTWVWVQKYYTRDGYSYPSPYYRNVVLSKLRHAKLDCRGAACGKVDDAIVDVAAHRVAFISIDPDQNFLGIGDTKRLVPWPVVGVNLDNTVRIDATKEMVLSSPKTPSELTVLAPIDQSDAVYKAYGVSRPAGWSRPENEAMGHDRTDIDSNR